MPSRRPLSGAEVLILRPRAKGGGLAGLLRRRGARVVALPAIAIRSGETRLLRGAARRAAGSAFDWVFLTSANGVEAWRRAVSSAGLRPADLRGIRFAAVGPRTASALRRAGYRVELVPGLSTAGALLSAWGKMGRKARGSRILLPQGDIAPPDLARGLRRAGAEVTRLAAYRTIFPAGFRRRLMRTLSRRRERWVVFSSASAVQHFKQALSGRAAALRGRFRCMSIGPVTSAALRTAGFSVSAEAREPSDRGIVQAIERAALRSRRNGTVPDATS